VPSPGGGAPHRVAGPPGRRRFSGGAGSAATGCAAYELNGSKSQ
jgi:hypothetical protein